MESTDLEMVEKTLNITLPNFYKCTMLNYPLVGLKYVQEYLLNIPDSLIEINQKFRKDGFQKKPWPNNLYIIGLNSENSFNFIDINGADESVYHAHNETKFNPKNILKHRSALNFQQFINSCKVMEEIIGRDEIK
jgi:hypothetical protein